MSTQPQVSIEPQCDFCCDDNAKPIASYSCKDFLLNSESMSQGAWLACQVCDQLLQAGRLLGLIRFAATGYLKKYNLPNSEIDWVIDQIRQSYRGFLKYKTGERHLL